MNAEQLKEIKRHFSVVSEALRSDIRRIAEGHTALRHEGLEPHEEIRLDQHIHTIETDIATLKSRIDHLETNRS
jgi:hypothetical protein